MDLRRSDDSGAAVRLTKRRSSARTPRRFATDQPATGLLFIHPTRLFSITPDSCSPGLNIQWRRCRP
jgi:hypothetical protein